MFWILVYTFIHCKLEVQPPLLMRCQWKMNLWWGTQGGNAPLAKMVTFRIRLTSVHISLTELFQHHSSGILLALLWCYSLANQFSLFVVICLVDLISLLSKDIHFPMLQSIAENIYLGDTNKCFEVVTAIEILAVICQI